MKKSNMLFLLMLSLLQSCNKNTNEISSIDDIVLDSTTYENNSNDDNDNMEIILKIDNKIIDVKWEDNESVVALKELAKQGITINMSKYSTFEQVGSIGKVLPSNDIQMTTNPGDIVLYSSNQLVIFYGSNSWRYTYLGHIDLDKDSLKELLGNQDVKITLSIK